MRHLQPRLMMINYNDPDYVHWGNLSHYTRGDQRSSTTVSGSLVAEAAQALEHFYRGQHLVFVHRARLRAGQRIRLIEVPCQHHFNSRTSREIWALLVGPGIAQGQSSSTARCSRSMWPEPSPRPWDSRLASPRAGCWRKRSLDAPPRLENLSAPPMTFSTETLVPPAPPPRPADAALSAPPAPRADAAGGGLLHWIGRGLAFVWKWLLGAVALQSWFFAFFAVGWTMRFMQRTAFKSWWAAGHRGRGDQSFRTFASEADEWRDQSVWPHWWLGPKPGRLLRERRVPRALFGGAAANIRLGVQGLFNIALVMAVPGCLWLASWHIGWTISFYKEYEHHYWGYTLGLLGVAAFVPLMFFLPLAQARQAVTGDWRAFWQWRTVRRIARRQWLGMLVLAAMYLVFGTFTIVLKTSPMLKAYDKVIEGLGQAELLEIANGMFFGHALLVFPLYVLLRWAATCVYARGLLKAVRDGEIPLRDLGPAEFETLRRCDLVREDVEEWSAARRAARWSLTLPIRAATGTASALAFGALAFFLYVGQFFFIHPVQGWLNLSLVQSPMCNYTPFHLSGRGPWGVVGELTAMGLLFCIGFAVWRIAQPRRA